MDDCNWCDRSQIAHTDNQYHPGRFGFPLKDPFLLLRPTQSLEKYYNYILQLHKKAKEYQCKTFVLS